MNTLIILEDADRELRQAVVWYEERSSGLGLRFVDVVVQKLEIIRQHPERNPKRKINFVRLLLKFSHILLFTLSTRKNQ